MQIDDTTARWLAGLLIAAAGSLVTATWRLARQSKADEKEREDLRAENAELRADVASLSDAVFGNERKDPPMVGLRSRLRTAEKQIVEQAKMLRAVWRALRIPPTSDEHAIVEAVRRAIAEQASTFAPVANEDTGSYRRALPEPLPPPPPRRRPPLPTGYSGEDPGGEDVDQ